MQNLYMSNFVVMQPAAGVRGLLPRADHVAAAYEAACWARTHRSPNAAGRSVISGAEVPMMHSRAVEFGSGFFASLSHSSALSSSNSAVFSYSHAPLWKQSSSFNGAPIGHHRRRFTLRINANVNLGEFGARDPTAAEVESNFGDKVIGNQGTDHIILIPPSLLGLAERRCTPIPQGSAVLSEAEATSMLRKVVGWRLAKTNSGLNIWTEWKLKDFGAGIILFDRIAAVAAAEEHFPDLHLQGRNIARAELSTQSIGGLSMNDFITAAKIDNIKTSDLVKKNRFWA